MYKSAIAGLFVAGVISAGCDRPSQQATEPAADTQPSKAPVSDAWITTKIQAQYFADADVKGRNIDVTTNNGIVALHGHVDTDGVRQRAIEIVQSIEGVTRIDDRLTMGSVPSQAATDRVEDRVTSGWVTTKIQAQYFADADVKGRDIDVTTHDGEVTLNGNVDSEAARERAIEIARRTDGVRHVMDHLRVERTDTARADSARRSERGGSSRRGDAEISSRIQAKYYVDENVRGNDIDVDTSHGVVTLTGTVDTEAERRRAVNIARRTWGVDDVRDQLRVERVVATSGRQETDAADFGDTLEDAWITTKIQSKFFVDDDVRGRNIDVSTNQGVVTLAGEVENVQARRQAVALARETGGVTRVVDLLKTVPQKRTRDVRPPARSK